MKKKILIALLFIMVCTSIIYVTNSYALNASTMISGVTGGDTTSAQLGKTGISTILNPILVIIKTVAVGIGVIMLTVLGIKYMSAAPSEKANIKNNMMAFAIGSIMVFGAAQIVQTVMEFSTKTIT